MPRRNQVLMRRNAAQSQGVNTGFEWSDVGFFISGISLILLLGYWRTVFPEIDKVIALIILLILAWGGLQAVGNLSKNPRIRRGQGKIILVSFLPAMLVLTLFLSLVFVGYSVAVR